MDELHQPFLEAIANSPDDLGPRLVYADWLDEQSDPRGRFVRLQCESLGLAADDPQLILNRLEVAELMKQHGANWSSFSGSGFGQPPITRFHGGVEETIEFNEAMLDSLPTLPRSAVTIRRATVQAMSSRVFQPLLERLAPQLESLAIRLGDSAAYESLMEIPLPKLRHLSIFGVDKLDQILAWLPGSQCAERLESLAMGGRYVKHRLMRPIFESKRFESLTSFGLPGAQMPHPMLGQLAAAPWVGNLTSLRITNHATAEGLTALLPKLTGLRNLSLPEWPIACRDLMTHPSLVNLQELTLVTEGTLEGLFQEGQLRLRRLNVTENLTHADVPSSFLQSQVLNKLTHLSMYSSSGLEALGQACFTPNLFRLDASYSKISPQTLASWLESDRWANLHVLVVRIDPYHGHKAGDAVLGELLRSPMAKNLLGLAIFSAGSKQDDVKHTLAALLESRMLDNLRYVVLANSSAPVRRKLKERFGEHVGYRQNDWTANSWMFD